MHRLTILSEFNLDDVTEKGLLSGLEKLQQYQQRQIIYLCTFSRGSNLEWKQMRNSQEVLSHPAFWFSCKGKGAVWETAYPVIKATDSTTASQLLILRKPFVLVETAHDFNISEAIFCCPSFHPSFPTKNGHPYACYLQKPTADVRDKETRVTQEEHSVPQFSVPEPPAWGRMSLSTNQGSKRGQTN